MATNEQADPVSLDALRAQTRWLVWWIAATLVVAIIGLGIALVRIWRTPDEIRAHRFVIVDQDGNVRAVLGHRDETTELQLRDPSAKRASVSLGLDGQKAWLRLRGDRQQSKLVEMETSSDAATLSLAGPSASRVVLRADNTSALVQANFGHSGLDPREPKHSAHLLVTSSGAEASPPRKVIHFNYPCKSARDCTDEPGGSCDLDSVRDNRWCSYPDRKCPSGRHWGEILADGGPLATGKCVSPAPAQSAKRGKPAH